MEWEDETTLKNEILDKIRLHIPDPDYSHLNHLFNTTFKRLHSTVQKFKNFPLHYMLHLQTIIYPFAHSILTIDWFLSRETLCARLTAMTVFVNSELDKINA